METLQELEPVDAGSMLASGRLIVGFRLECSTKGRSIVTSTVQSIECDELDAACAD
jgi:hypothetical protein